MDCASPGGTDTSTDPDLDKNQAFEQGHAAAAGLTPPDSGDRSNGELGPKTLRRLAQNREAARRSRLRKKAYVQQLESSGLRLAHLEQELQRARQQGFLVSTLGDQPDSENGDGASSFYVEYARWLEEHHKQADELRAAVSAHAGDGDLQAIVDTVMARCDEIFRLKGAAAKADAFRVLSGTWTTPVESCSRAGWSPSPRSSSTVSMSCGVPPCKPKKHSRERWKRCDSRSRKPSRRQDRRPRAAPTMIARAKWRRRWESLAPWKASCGRLMICDCGFSRKRGGN
ncbi:transcription factor TGAL1-like isoform X2 [Triticum dicoccoides]|uniref:transcription factor TGAL1-like isoform X2 n=1 Tax=Triticum dicoccoides TaxID=85692 RepID=UPI000E7D1E6C|nr:transcription factor TGAL1-like isoform X2 [Triticum dicoccoides]